MVDKKKKAPILDSKHKFKKLPERNLKQIT